MEGENDKIIIYVWHVGHSYLQTLIDFLIEFEQAHPRVYLLVCHSAVFA